MSSVLDTSRLSERRDIAPASDTGALIAAIANAARDPQCDVDKMERLMAMHERITTRNAEALFNSAMSACQSEMRPISADATNPQTHSKYASYAQLDRALRPIYTKHGFSLSFDEADSQKPDHVRVVCYVSNSGFTRTYRRDMPADGKGAKGGDVMTKTHASGAAQSYGMRYLLKGIFNIAVGEDDKDGNDVEPTITPEQAKTLEALIKEGGGDMAKALRFMKVESLADIPAKNYETVVKDIKAVNAAKARAKGAK